jgi:RHS repeat-associated protein
VHSHEPSNKTVRGGDESSASFAPTRSVLVVGGNNNVTVTARDPSSNVSSRMFQVTNSGESAAFAYDANGNLISDGQRTLEWDARDKLVAVNVANHRTEFLYDGQQRLVRLTERENGNVESDTVYVWCATAICEERTSDGSVIRRSFQRGEEFLGAKRFFARDRLGSVTEVTDLTGALLAGYRFDPYGRRTLAAGADITPVGFTGAMWQQSTGTWVTLHRNYNPSLGRWLREDPIGLRGGTNLYAYVEGNPVNLTDPYGLSPSCGWAAATSFIKCFYIALVSWDFAAGTAIAVACAMLTGPAAAACIAAMIKAMEIYEGTAVVACIGVALYEKSKCEACEVK